MRTQNYRLPLMVFQSIFLLFLLQQCAWLRGEKDPGEIIKPVPVGGYESLSTRIHYPRTIREAGIEGRVVVTALVSSGGQIKETRVAESLHPELDVIVTNAIKRTLFEPATRNGRPEQVWISIPFVFSLKDWSPRSTPFGEFIMTIHPDPSYKNFQVSIEGQVRDGQDFPIRLECLLPLNATNPWVKAGNSQSPATGLVIDDRGEWLIFQISTTDLSFGFTYMSLDEILDQKFLYEFALNHALPDWELRIIYGSQIVNFSQTPDRVIQLENGESQFEYDFSAMDAYESRFLEIALQ